MTWFPRVGLLVGKFQGFTSRCSFLTANLSAVRPKASMQSTFISGVCPRILFTDGMSPNSAAWRNSSSRSTFCEDWWHLYLNKMSDTQRKWYLSRFLPMNKLHFITSQCFSLWRHNNHWCIRRTKSQLLVPLQQMHLLLKTPHAFHHFSKIKPAWHL